MTVKMEKPLILICCLLIGQACSGTNLEVCSSSFKPEEDTHIELKHTRQVDPGTVCQCTAKAIWTVDCLKISYYSSSQQNHELPEGVAVNRSEDQLGHRRFCVIVLVFQVDKLSGNVLSITDPSKGTVQCKVLQTTDNDHEPIPVMTIVIVCSVFIMVVLCVIVVYCVRRHRLRRGSCISLRKIRHQRNDAPICEQDNGNETYQRFQNDSNAYTYIETTEFKKVDVPVKEKPFVTVVGYDHLGTGNGEQLCCDDGPVKTYQTGNAYDHAFFVREASKANVTSAYDRTNFRQNDYDHVIRENERKTRVVDVMNETYSHPSQNLDSNYQQIRREGSDREESCNNAYDRVQGTEFMNDVTHGTGDKSDVTHGTGDKSDVTHGTGDKSDVSHGTGDKSDVTHGTGDKSDVSHGTGDKSDVTHGTGDKSTGDKSDVTHGTGDKCDVTHEKGDNSKAVHDARDEKAIVHETGLSPNNTYDLARAIDCSGTSGRDQESGEG